MAKKQLGTGAIAEAFGVDHDTVRRWVAAGHLKSLTSGPQHLRFAPGTIGRIRAKHGIPKGAKFYTLAATSKRLRLGGPAIKNWPPEWLRPIRLFGGHISYLVAEVESLLKPYGDETHFYTRREVARLLNFTNTRSVNRYLDTLPHIRLPNGHLRFPKSKIDAIVDELERKWREDDATGAAT